LKNGTFILLSRHYKIGCFLPYIAQILSDIKDWYLLHPDCVRCMVFQVISSGHKETARKDDLSGLLYGVGIASKHGVKR